jgi:hypothetical protein
MRPWHTIEVDLRLIALAVLAALVTIAIGRIVLDTVGLWRYLYC